MLDFNYIAVPQNYIKDTAFVVHLDSINNKSDLLNQVYTKMGFPDYFGFNWDAMYDCLCDFNWIKNKDIVIVHDDIPILSEKEFKTYLEILKEALETWDLYDEHNLEVVFPRNSEKSINKILKNLEEIDRKINILAYDIKFKKKLTEKHISIYNFIERLKLVVDFKLLKVIDFWDSDYMSIGLVKNKKLIYIAKSNYINSVDPLYYFNLELFDKNNYDYYNVVKEGENVSECELIKEIKEYFGV